MSCQPDYSILDQPEILAFAFYPRRDWTPAPPGASDYLVPVEGGVSISCRFYPAGEGAPCILFFHGNGEVACDYDWIAPVYNREGISLFVADYRGYGLSGGRPTFSSMAADAHLIFDFFLKNVWSWGRSDSLFLMGRSMGAHSVVELACHYPERLKGLIVESGSAMAGRLLKRLGVPVAPGKVEKIEEASLARIRSITLPILILHGEQDILIPSSEASRFFDSVGSRVKRLVIIPGAGHNDIMMVGMEPYFAAIREHVFGLPADTDEAER